jgi:hypothetical protein
MGVRLRRTPAMLAAAWLHDTIPSCLVRVAEDKGFEPLRGCPQHAFQACALGH